MQSLDRDYILTHTLEVPEIAPMPAIRSARAATVAHWFGIDEQIHAATKAPSQTAVLNKPEARRAKQNARDNRALLRSLLPARKQIAFLTGPSGAGKTSMLRALRCRRPRATFLDLNQIELPDVPLVDCFNGAALDQTLALLSQVGLAEAWSYLRTPEELSEGQRWRLKLALAMQNKGSGFRVRGSGKSSDLNPEPRTLNPRAILIIDEFAALLDRITAAVVARCLRRTISATPNLCAIVATSHEDLTRALAPDTIVHCDFRLIEVWRRIESSEE
jgi:ABC-type glutathione transport system ATPase component